MSQTLEFTDVLTLDEAARYLRLPEESVRRLAVQQGLPGRQVDGHWRFLRSAIQDWLRGPTGKEALLQQAGVLADDPSLSTIVEQIYRDRGRPET